MHVRAMSLVILTLAVLAPSFASQCRSPPCCCNGQAGASDTRDRPDYGTRCARWDAPDEEPWCVVDNAACRDDTFSSDGGHYWSHVPCSGVGDDFVPDSTSPDVTPDDAGRDGAGGTAADAAPGAVFYHTRRGGNMVAVAASRVPAELPNSFSEQVGVSLLVYASTSNDPRASATIAFVRHAQECAQKTGASVEILVNVDTAAKFNGAVEALLPVAGNNTFVLMSDGVGEPAVWNRLARISRGQQLVLVGGALGHPKKAACEWFEQGRRWSERIAAISDSTMLTCAQHIEAPPATTTSALVVRRSAWFDAGGMTTLDALWMCACTSCQTAPNVVSKTDASFLINYWGGTGRTSVHVQNLVKKIIPRCVEASELHGTRTDLFVNVDSRHIRFGDFPAMVAGGIFSAGIPVTVMLSPNIHELRAYNRLALLSQATSVIMMQDDHIQQHGARHWVAMGVAMLAAHPHIAAVGFKQGFYVVTQMREEQMGAKPGVPPGISGPQGQKHIPILLQAPRCVDPATKVPAEAFRCVDVGPLMFRRSSFLAAGGYNETLTVRGKAGSVLVDCEIEARLWLAGFASVLLAPVDTWPPRSVPKYSTFKPFTDMFNGDGVETPHAAWEQDGMFDDHFVRLKVYANRFEHIGNAFTKINREMRKANALFTCEVEKMETCGSAGCIKVWPHQEQKQCDETEGLTCWKYPWTTMDCGIKDGPNLCEHSELLGKQGFRSGNEEPSGADASPACVLGSHVFEQC